VPAIENVAKRASAVRQRLAILEQRYLVITTSFQTLKFRMRRC